MSLKVIFAPDFLLSYWYTTSVWLTSKIASLNTLSFKFEKLIENALNNQANELFQGKRVKLIGYDYTQYNENLWSYFPMQLIISEKVKGIIWIKWKCEENGYFVFNASKEDDFKYIPSCFRFCDKSENSQLMEKYPQPEMEYNICSPSNIQFIPDAVLPNKFSPTFCYELQRQLTEEFVKLTGIGNIKEYLGISRVMLNSVLHLNGFSYAVLVIHSKPYRRLDKKLKIQIRWKSKTDSLYIEPTCVIGSDEVTFEFSDMIPTNNPLLENVKIANENEVIAFIKR